MKNLAKATFLISAALLMSPSAQGVKKIMGQIKQSEQINETMRFTDQHEDNQVTIFNVYGSIDVEGYAGDEIEVEAVNQVYGTSQTVVDQGLKEIGLNFEQHGNRLYIYLDSPFTYFDPESGELWHSDTCWRRDDCSRKHVKKDYKYQLDIKVRLPKHLSLEVSAINNGDITVSGVHGKNLNVSNINGAIDMVDVSGQTFVNAINKDINIAYSENPTADSEFESINGDLNITFAGQPNAEVVYKTMHGDFYTAYDVSMMAPVVKRTSKQNKHGIHYKLDAESRLQVGDGGPEYRFRTLNGDIKIK